MKLSFKFLKPAVDRRWKNMRTTCALRSCQNKALMRGVPQSRAGIRIGEGWYCSVDCFAIAARTPLAALTSNRVTEMPRTPRLSIGLVMISKGYLTDDQLRVAIDQSKARGEDLENALIRLGLAGERQIAAARAAQWGYPVLGNDRVGQPVETDIPTTLLRLCNAVPLHSSPQAKRVLLGFIYRVEHTLLHSIEELTGCRAEPCFITPTEFQEQNERVTALANHEEVVIENAATPAHMARTVGGFAVEVAAREARFSTCRDHVWVRLTGKQRTLDVLFQQKTQSEGARRKDSSDLAENYRSLG